MSEANTEKQQAQLAPGKENLNGFEYVSTRYDAKIPIGLGPKDILNPAFWAHHAVQMRPMDEIRARAEDGTWMANLVVLDSSRTWVKVQLLETYNLSTLDVSLTQATDKAVLDHINEHDIVHRGPRGWSVVRRGDKAVLHEDEKTRPEAAAWLEAHARVAVMGDPTEGDKRAKPKATTKA